MRQSGEFIADTANAWAKWRVWAQMARNDLRNRYARSVFGPAWLFISFALWAVGVGLIYARLFNLDSAEFVPFLTIGFAVWSFITGSFVEGSSALLGASGYIKQFNLPKQVYLLRSLLTQLVAFGLGLLVCFVVLAIYSQLTLQSVLYALPGLLLLCLAGGIHVFLSAYVTPYLRDFPHAMGSIMSVLFFVTPIIFTPQMLHEKGLDGVYRYNPFYYLIEGVRYPLLHSSPPDMSVWLGALAYCVVGAIVVGLFCRHLDKRVVYAL